MMCLVTRKNEQYMINTAMKAYEMGYQINLEVIKTSNFTSPMRWLLLIVANKSGYNYKQNAQEIFESFFGTTNPFATFGFGDNAPFAAKLNKPGPKKLDPVLYNLECTLSELYNGCTKKFNVSRKRFTPEGELLLDSKQLVINVKPGWKKGTKITFPNEGDESKNAIPADIVFVVQEKILPENGYTREGNNLIYTYKITLADALSDCSLQVPTLDNRLISIACPEVVTPYYEKRVKGECIRTNGHMTQW